MSQSLPVSAQDALEPVNESEQRISRAQRNRFIGVIIGQDFIWGKELYNLDGYFAWLDAVLARDDGGLSAHVHPEDKCTAVISAITLIRQHKDESWRSVYDSWRLPEAINASCGKDEIFALALQTWLQMDVNKKLLRSDQGMITLEFGWTGLDLDLDLWDSDVIDSIGPDRFTWDIDKSLQANIDLQFASVQSTATGDVPAQCTAVNLVTFYGVKIRWTACLKKHLTTEEKRGRPVLWIYEHTDYARLLSTAESPLPSGLLAEVLETIMLLFPRHDTATENFLKRKGRPHLNKFNLKKFKYTPRMLNRSNYKFYDEKIAHILDIYNRPTTHWWHFLIDRRNKKEHFTQLIALWAFIFAFLSLVFGLLSVIYAVKQYELGVATACIGDAENPRLRKYCA